MLILEHANPQLRIRTSSCHGKLDAGWCLTQGLICTVQRGMTKRIHDEIDEVLARAARGRRSRSVHRSSGSGHGGRKPATQIAVTWNRS